MGLACWMAASASRLKSTLGDYCQRTGVRSIRSGARGRGRSWAAVHSAAPAQVVEASSQKTNCIMCTRCECTRQYMAMIFLVLVPTRAGFLELGTGEWSRYFRRGIRDTGDPMHKSVDHGRQAVARSNLAGGSAHELRRTEYSRSTQIKSANGIHAFTRPKCSTC